MAAGVADHVWTCRDIAALLDLAAHRSLGSWFNAGMTNPQPWWLTWPVEEVAAVILPLFSNAADQLEQAAIRSIVNWCKTGTYRNSLNAVRASRDPDQRAVMEAIQVLEHANLLLLSGDLVTLTRLGWHALQTDTVREHLGLSGAPPTA
jgi:hypothetical protein